LNFFAFISVSVKAPTLITPTPPAKRAMRSLSLSLSKSEVHSGLCVIDAAGQAYEGLSSSSVHFAPLSDEDIDWWIDTKEWEGRSGAFQIDGRGQLMIERIEGDWTSVVGLPVFLLGRLLGKAGDEM
jgi:septum formation protein